MINKLKWYLDIDWDSDGILEGEEGGRVQHPITVDRGRQRQFSRSGFQAMAVGRATIVLDNYDNRYSAWNEDSDLYPNIQFRRYARLSVGMDVDSTVAVDYSGQNHHGTYEGTVGLAYGAGIDNALYAPLFETSDFVNLYSTGMASRFNSNAGTISIWVKLPSMGIWADGTERMVFRIGDGSTNNMVQVYKAATGEIVANYVADGVAYSVTSAVQTTTDWLHIVVTWTYSDELEVGQFILYLNNATIGSDPGFVPFEVNLASNQCCIGATSTSGGNSFSGLIAQCAIWRVVLSTDERTALYEARGNHAVQVADTQFRHLVGYWPLGEGTRFDVMRGYIDEPKVTGRDKATVVLEDGWRWLKERKAEIAVQTDVTTGEAITQILEATNWPEPDWLLGEEGHSELEVSTFLADEVDSLWSWGKDIDDGLDTIPYWWGAGFAAPQIHDLVNSEAGFAYVAANGRFVFQDRGALYESTSSFTLKQDQILRDVSLGEKSENLWNRVVVQANPLTQASADTLWQHRGSVPFVRAGESLTLYAEFNDPCTDIQALVASTDYTANLASDGSSTDLTAQITITKTNYGEMAKLVIANAGPHPAYITLLKIRGDALETLNVTPYISEDATSRDKFGERELVIDLPWQQDVSTAKDYADWLLSWMKDPRPAPRILIDARPWLQFAHDLGTHFTLNVAYFGLTDDFRIGYIRHRSEGSLHRIRTEWRMESMDTADYWLLDVDDRTELGETTTLGY